MYYIYCHTNLTNGKKYIGISQQESPNKRWQNGLGYNGNKHFFSAIKKYGWNGFSHEILHSNLSQDEACQLEISLIAFYDTMNTSFGYNKTSGGEKSYTRTEEQKAYLRKINLGSNNPCYGKKLSQEHREKISLGNKGKGHDEQWRKTMSEKAKKTPVICLNTGQIFNSQKEAGIWAEIKGKPSKIGMCCRGERNSTGKDPITKEPLRWAYYIEGDLI